MNSSELTLFGLLLIIASQTSYTSYRMWRQNTHARNNDIFVDTSVLMDGRIVAIAETGFVPGRLLVPRSVIGELQLLADQSDAEKRSRARRGLDVISELQKLETVECEIYNDDVRVPKGGGVDERLLDLAKAHGSMLCTIDFNLNKVASVQGIQVLNVNDLAKNLRMAYLPGDRLRIGLTDTGSDSHQAVGHVDDGTMVVVENARKKVGTTVEIEVIRSLQTAAGRMLFAKLAEQSTKPAKRLSGAREAKSESNKKAAASIPKQSSSRSPRHSSGSRESSAPSNKHGAHSEGVQQARRPRSKKSKEDTLLELVDNQ